MPYPIPSSPRPNAPSPHQSNTVRFTIRQLLVPQQFSARCRSLSGVAAHSILELRALG